MGFQVQNPPLCCQWYHTFCHYHGNPFPTEISNVNGSINSAIPFPAARPKARHGRADRSNADEYNIRIQITFSATATKVGQDSELKYHAHNMKRASPLPFAGMDCHECVTNLDQGGGARPRIDQAQGARYDDVRSLTSSFNVNIDVPVARICLPDLGFVLPPPSY